LGRMAKCGKAEREGHKFGFRLFLSKFLHPTIAATWFIRARTDSVTLALTSLLSESRNQSSLYHKGQEPAEKIIREAHGVSVVLLSMLSEFTGNYLAAN